MYLFFTLLVYWLCKTNMLLVRVLWNVFVKTWPEKIILIKLIAPTVLFGMENVKYSKLFNIKTNVADNNDTSSVLYFRNSENCIYWKIWFSSSKLSTFSGLTYSFQDIVNISVMYIMQDLQYYFIWRSTS